VAISSVSQAREEVAGEFNKKHGMARRRLPGQHFSKEDLQRLVNETNAAFGKIDIVVCNAASNPYYGPMAGINDDQFSKILSNNIIQTTG
jgi:NAD(P)-dependent dehydrogenase (short-subunit alcohol dehydrogenase family)